MELELDIAFKKFFYETNKYKYYKITGVIDEGKKQKIKLTVSSVNALL